MMGLEDSGDAWRAVRTFGEDSELKFLRVGGWCICIGLALLECWSGRFYTDPDGISYLDMSDVLLNHNWHLLINGWWSPLYPLLIGAATWLVRPSAYWELPIVHVVNFIIFLGALASFEFFLRQVIRFVGREGEGEEASGVVPMPCWMWELLGYSLFAWSAFILINGIRKVTPDLCVAIFVYLDAGLLLRLHERARRLRVSILLGLTLGLGYYAKAIVFPMAFVFMAVAFLLAGELKKGAIHFVTTLLIFCVIAAPLFVGISKRVGRPSFGEPGRINYAWAVDGEGGMLPFYSSPPPSYLEHPISRIHEDPNVFEFGQPLKSTYALWFDPPIGTLA